MESRDPLLAVIGGGVVGVGTLHALTKKGWSDVVLVERNELTSGSTWHAAGLLPLFNMSYSVGKIHQYSVDYYGGLEDYDYALDLIEPAVEGLIEALKRDYL